MSHIAVDLTPMMPGGENGGAKVFAIELLKGLQKAAVDDRFLLLTASWNHDELGFLESNKMQRLCVIPDAKASSQNIFQQYIPAKLAPSFFSALNAIGRKFKRVWHSVGNQLLRGRGVELLFCPFSAPHFYEPGIPVISVIHDLQHMDYPHLFDSSEIQVRDRFLSDVREKAFRVVCVSEYVRQSIIKHLNIEPDKILAIHNSIHKRLAMKTPADIPETLSRLGLVNNRYALYPANFWPHKNHRMLLTALGVLTARNPDLELELVFTGALKDAEKSLKLEAAAMGLSSRVHFLGFLPQPEYEAVWHGCRFLIYPSLYEGFGMPILEAMAMGKPVLCSNVTSLPEVAGDAALFFDPRKPIDMVEKIEKLLGNPDLEAQMIDLGFSRSENFSSEQMTNQYRDVFHASLKADVPMKDELTGLYADGWTGKKMTLTYHSNDETKILEAVLEAPAHIPASTIKVDLVHNGKKIRKYKVKRGERITISQPVAAGNGYFAFFIRPTFSPAKEGMGPDTRHLGLLCHGCSVLSQAE